MYRNLSSRVLRRNLSSSLVTRNLFGGGKMVGSTQNMAPSNKLETASNPADLLKRNDILMYSQKPINYIESVKENGFHLANNILITSPNDQGQEVGTLLIENESFEVNLADGGYKLVNGFIVDFNAEQVLAIFGKVHPKPEIVVVGLGRKSRRLSDESRKYFSQLGIQLEVGDSQNAAKIYDLLATERPGVIAALLLPPNV
ncbi:CIC11C00000003347 [Sungouiella intermedia]|uniref:NADH dehydrogenase [ubiquinone] 1 alpha subcomplex assembly factor 3 n=1 Tax=Sungouiella intermedia TaxID=45354 RepID=A0A1L0D8D9_9ASCO|nr:CIC11C00000003347 [[Candida] intermedia]